MVVAGWRRFSTAATVETAASAATVSPVILRRKSHIVIAGKILAGIALMTVISVTVTVPLTAASPIIMTVGGLLLLVIMILAPHHHHLSGMLIMIGHKPAAHHHHNRRLLLLVWVHAVVVAHLVGWGRGWLPTATVVSGGGWQGVRADVGATRRLNSTTIAAPSCRHGSSIDPQAWTER